MESFLLMILLIKFDATLNIKLNDFLCYGRFPLVSECFKFLDSYFLFMI